MLGGDPVYRDLFITTIMSDVARSVKQHVHEVVRKSSLRSEGSSSDSSGRTSKQWSSSMTYRSSMMERIVNSESSREELKSIRSSTLPSFGSSLTNQNLNNLFLSELRSVIVVFIKIDVESTMTELTIDEENADRSIEGITQSVESYILPRSKIEFESDLELLNLLQTCYSSITSTLHKHHGQIRQFILDDKGSVCIGTFGLKGSNSKNAAESAITASDTIINSLISDSQINASIGITSGKAFCGLVGSKDRFEYSVMGSSVNLSARLMCLADNGSIYCDNIIIQRDNLHTFQKGIQINAKGYTDRITIYSPIFPRELPILKNKIDHTRSFSSKSIANLDFITVGEFVQPFFEQILKFIHNDDNNNSNDISTFRMKLFIITSSAGLGKSHMLRYISRELSKLNNFENNITGKKGFEVFVVCGKSMVTNSPFSIWRPVIMNMLKSPSQINRPIDILRKRRKAQDFSNSDRISSSRSSFLGYLNNVYFYIYCH